MDNEVAEMTTPDGILPNDVLAIGRRKMSRYLIVFLVLAVIAAGIWLAYPFIHFDAVLKILNTDNHLFYWMVLVGFLAEMVAGSMGMGYGVICTTILLIWNVPTPVISASIHSAEVFTTGAGGFSHYKLGNVNKKLIKRLAIPAIIGAVLGALALSYLGENYAKATKPFLALYTMYLGIRILQNAFGKNAKKAPVIRKKTNVQRLGFLGGFIDSFGGGGWGPVVTGTFIKNGRSPKYVIGSSTVAKFMLTLASAITFIFTVGIQHWNIVAGLLIGGVITAPFSAKLTSKLPVRKMFVAVGLVVIIMSLVTIYRTVFL